MNVLHLLVSGGTGGIEVLMKNYAQDSTHKNIFVFVWKSGEIAKMMEQNGASVYVTNAAVEGMFTTLKKIRQICRKEQIDIAVSHNSAPLLKLALIYIKIFVPNVKVVAYAHANARDICEHKRKKGLLLRKLVHRLGFAAADGIVAISDSVKASLQIYLGVNEKKIFRIYNGTQIARTCDLKDRTSEKNILKLIYVGRLIQEKGVQNTLFVLSRLKGKLPFMFTVVGDGPYRQTLEKMANQLGLEDCVTFQGNRTDVSQQLEEADVFIHLPEWDEGFGITVIEALASGRLCIVNQRGALPEIIEHGKNGFILPADDPEAIQNLLEEIWDMSDEARSRMQNNARSSARRFSLEYFVRELDEYFREICS